ncbi:MAG: hypothetical protein FWC77_00570 [Defluviitaleaceae bacterium]|nr:hypothetical protein [Defluviitaleaceae bacterium]
MEHYKGFDEKSFMLGMIEAFSEMVAQNVKPLALGPIMEQSQWGALKNASDAITARFNIKSYVEMPLMSSDLAPDEALEGKIVVLYYKHDEVLSNYLNLKAESEGLKASGSYDAAARKRLSISLRKLLGYADAI